MKKEFKEFTIKQLKREAKRLVKKYKDKQETKLIIKLIKNETEPHRISNIVADLTLFSDLININDLVDYFSKNNIIQILEKQKIKL